MPGFPITDKNGNTYNLDVNAVGANYAATNVLADQDGNKYTLAPGLVALPVQAEGLKATYRYAVLGFTPVATPTDILEIKGSATKTVRIRRIRVSGVATAAANMPVQLQRRSTASTGGGSVLTALTAAKTDANYAAATAAVGTFGTANPTLGTAAGGLAGAGRVQLPASGTGVAAIAMEWEFDVNAMVLRGVSDFLYVNLSGAAVPAGGALDLEIVLSEDAS